MIWPLWPGCAFLVAVLLLTSRKLWPALLAAGITGFVTYDLQAGLTIRSIALLNLGDAVEILIAALGVSYTLGGMPRLNSVKSLARYSLFAVVLAPIAAASVSARILGGDYWVAWR
jgi:integral membrane sensor domain MASE1